MDIHEYGRHNLMYRSKCPICGHRFYSHYGKHQHYMAHVRKGQAVRVPHPICPLTLPNGFVEKSPTMDVAVEGI